MRKHILALTGCVLVLAGGAVTGSAQQQAPVGGDITAQQTPSPETGQDQPIGHPMMHPRMAALMMILMDTDGDGALSLEEVQAVHARMFRYVDENKDGKLSRDELRAFMRDRMFGPSQRFGRDDDNRRWRRGGDRDEDGRRGGRNDDDGRGDRRRRDRDE